MRTIVNNLSKEGVVSSIESVHGCVGNVRIKTKIVCFAEKRVETVAVSSGAVTRPGWAAVQYLCQNCRIKHILQWWGWHSVCSQNFEHVQSTRARFQCQVYEFCRMIVYHQWLLLVPWCCWHVLLTGVDLAVEQFVSLMLLLGRWFPLTCPGWAPVLPATRHRWTRPSFTPAKQAGSQFIYTEWMEGWVGLGGLVKYQDSIPANDHPFQY